MSKIIGSITTLGLFASALATATVISPAAQADTTPPAPSKVCSVADGVILAASSADGFVMKQGDNTTEAVSGNSSATVKNNKVVLKPTNGGDADVAVTGMTVGDLLNAKDTKFKGVKVNATGDVKLNIWFDKNRDGQFFEIDDNGTFTGLGEDTYSTLSQTGEMTKLANDPPSPTGNIVDLVKTGELSTDDPIAIDAVAEGSKVKIKNLAGHMLANCTTATPPPPKFTPSVLKAANKCRVSKSDKRNWWNVSNVAGGRARTFWLHVSYGGKTTYQGAHTVAAGATAPVRTANGGKLTVSYYDGAGHPKFAYAWSNASKTC